VKDSGVADERAYDDIVQKLLTKPRARGKVVFNVTRICSRMRDWPACVAPAKNSFICVFIVMREKWGMRDAGHCAECC
jgi:hypothetical protein